MRVPTSVGGREALGSFVPRIIPDEEAPANMEETSTENAKISDSGYSNTGSNSQSHTSSETLPKPITKRKDKGYKKEFKDASTSFCTGPALIHDPLSAEPCKTLLERSIEEANVVELADATDSAVHNKNSITSAEVGLTSKIRPIDDFTSHSTDEFYAVISMADGLVLHASASLYTSLGYPIDSWTGKLFIDFLNPRDKYIFTDRIASEIATSRDFHPSGANGRKASIFCRLRRFNVCVSRSDQYVPYRINLVVQNFHDDKMSASQSHVMLFVASFQSVHSAYKVPQEIIIPTVFRMRHTATCQLSYVDPEVVQYLGYLPQDMIDRSLFDFYYPEDLPLIKEIYKIVINLESKSFKSKPYRFMIQNGSFVVLETEWSSFVNPWTKSVEFVVGQHRIREGPADPDVFHPPGNRKNDLLASISDEVLKEAKTIQKEIVSLLVEDVQRKLPSKATDFDLLSKKKELKSFAQYILQEIQGPATTKDQLPVHKGTSFSGYDSAMLGDISTHHEHFDSKSSTEIAPSYNQLNYQDNIDRFFNRSIDVTANNRRYASDEDNLRSSENSSDALDKNNASPPVLKYSFSTNESGNSGSAENLSSESTNQQSCGSRGETSNTTSNDKLLILTESLLYKHNEDMEKLMLQKHYEKQRNNSTSWSDRKAKANKQPSPRCNASHKSRKRLKRSASPIRDTDDNFKVSRYDSSVRVLGSVGQVLGSVGAKPNVTRSMETSPIERHESPKVNAWPPNSVIMPSTTTITQQCFIATNAYSQGLSRFPALPHQMFPVYYLPLPQMRDISSSSIIPQEHPGPPTPTNPFLPYFSYTMPSIVYPPIVGAQAPAALMYGPFPLIVPQVATALGAANLTTAPSTSSTTTTTTTTTTTMAAAVANNSFDLKRPANGETSAEAEPEPSQKIFSPSGNASPCLSNEGESFGIIDESTTTNTKDSYTRDDKANESSLFSNSLNKSCNSSSNAEQWHPVSSFQTQREKRKESSDNQTNFKAFGMRRKEPPWMEGVQLTPELIYKYEIKTRPLEDVLKADLEFLRESKQSTLVNEQLEQLFLDIDLKNFSSNLLLEDPGTSGANDDSSDGSHSLSTLNSCPAITGSLATTPWSALYKNICDL